MKASTKLFIVSWTIFVSACSGTPGAGDIKKNIEEFLSCPAISIENVKKTNGIDQGSFYTVSYTYSMVFPKGASNDDEYKSLFEDCPFSTQVLLGHKILGRGVGIGYPIEDGKEVELSGNINMVKSENGWIFQ